MDKIDTEKKSIPNANEDMIKAGVSELYKKYSNDYSSIEKHWIDKVDLQNSEMNISDDGAIYYDFADPITKKPSFSIAERSYNEIKSALNDTDIVLVFVYDSKSNYPYEAACICSIEDVIKAAKDAKSEDEAIDKADAIGEDLSSTMDTYLKDNADLPIDTKRYAYILVYDALRNSAKKNKVWVNHMFESEENVRPSLNESIDTKVKDTLYKELMAYLKESGFSTSAPSSFVYNVHIDGCLYMVIPQSILATAKGVDYQEFYERAWDDILKMQHVEKVGFPADYGFKKYIKADNGTTCYFGHDDILVKTDQIDKK